MKPSGILCGPLPLFAALKSFLGLRVALGCSLKLSGLSGAVCGCLLVYGALWPFDGLAGLGWAGLTGDEILMVLVRWPKMVPELWIFIDFASLNFEFLICPTDFQWFSFIELQDVNISKRDFNVFVPSDFEMQIFPNEFQ